MPSNSLSRDTIRSRVKRNNSCPLGKGPPSPLAPIEKIIVSMFIQRADMNQPLNTTNGLRLVKSLIAGTKCEEEISKHHRCETVLEESNTVPTF